MAQSLPAVEAVEAWSFPAVEAVEAWSLPAVEAVEAWSLAAVEAVEAWSLPAVEAWSLHCSLGRLSNTSSYITEAARWAAPSCSRLQPATDNGVRDGRSN